MINVDAESLDLANFERTTPAADRAGTSGFRVFRPTVVPVASFMNVSSKPDVALPSQPMPSTSRQADRVDLRKRLQRQAVEKIQRQCALSSRSTLVQPGRRANTGPGYANDCVGFVGPRSFPEAAASQQPLPVIAISDGRPNSGTASAEFIDQMSPETKRYELDIFLKSLPRGQLMDRVRSRLLRSHNALCVQQETVQKLSASHHEQSEKIFQLMRDLDSLKEQQVGERRVYVEALAKLDFYEKSVGAVDATPKKFMDLFQALAHVRADRDALLQLIDCDAKGNQTVDAEVALERAYFRQQLQEFLCRKCRFYSPKVLCLPCCDVFCTSCYAPESCADCPACAREVSRVQVLKNAPVDPIII